MDLVRNQQFFEKLLILVPLRLSLSLPNLCTLWKIASTLYNVAVKYAIGGFSMFFFCWLRCTTDSRQINIFINLKTCQLCVRSFCCCWYREKIVFVLSYTYARELYIYPILFLQHFSGGILQETHKFHSALNVLACFTALSLATQRACYSTFVLVLVY